MGHSTADCHDGSHFDRSLIYDSRRGPVWEDETIPHMISTLNSHEQYTGPLQNIQTCPCTSICPSPLCLCRNHCTPHQAHAILDLKI
eukprot:jgi/Botrbrau1/8739/Bobra.0090s0014.1